MSFVIKQNNTSPALLATLQGSDGETINVQGSSVVLKLKNLDTGVVTTKSMTINADNSVRYDWLVGDTEASGTYRCEFEVTYTDGTIETFPNDGAFSIVITPSL